MSSSDIIRPGLNERTRLLNAILCYKHELLYVIHDLVGQCSLLLLLD